MAKKSKAKARKPAKKSAKKAVKKIITPVVLTPEQIKFRRVIGWAIAAQQRATAKAHNACNHHKGGLIKGSADGKIPVKFPTVGDSPDFCVIKHQLSNGDWWIRCLRCGKTWTAPLPRSYTTPAQFEAALLEYEAAIKFNTRNTPSGSVQFLFSHPESYRELVAQ